MARASDVFPGGNGDARVNEVKAWLKSRGVRDFEPVSLFADQLAKVRTPHAFWSRICADNISRIQSVRSRSSRTPSLRTDPKRPSKRPLWRGFLDRPCSNLLMLCIVFKINTSLLETEWRWFKIREEYHYLSRVLSLACIRNRWMLSGMFLSCQAWRWVTGMYFTII